MKDFKRCLDLSLLSSFKLYAESVVKIFLPFLFYFGLTVFGSFWVGEVEGGIVSGLWTIVI